MTDFENDPDYEECLVTFFDVLGFRNLLNTRSGAEIRDRLSLFRRLSEGNAASARRSAEERMVSEAHTEIVSDAIVRSRTIETTRAAALVMPRKSYRPSQQEYRAQAWKILHPTSRGAATGTDETSPTSSCLLPRTDR